MQRLANDYEFKLQQAAMKHHELEVRYNQLVLERADALVELRLFKRAIRQLLK